MAVSPKQRAALNNALADCDVNARRSQVFAAFDAALEAVNWNRSALVDSYAADRDLAFLQENAGVDDVSVLENWDPHAEDDRRLSAVANRTVHLFEMTVSAEELAELASLDRRDVQRLVADDRLQEIDLARPRYPEWQVGAQGLLPGLAVLVPVIHRCGLSPDSIAAFMVLPNDELGGRAPVAHLEAGGDAIDVAALVGALARI